MLIKIRKLICVLFGHRSIQIFIFTRKWEYENWAQTDSVYVCERCDHESQKVWQQSV